MRACPAHHTERMHNPVDNPVDNDDTPSDAVSPIDKRHVIMLGMIVAGAMLLIAVVAVAGAIATVRP